MELATVAGAALGLAWGLAADRLAARWPAHADGSTRPVDWRTPLVAIAGAAAAGLAVARQGGDPVHLAVVGLVVAALVVLFATDLDQRLLPDVLTLPLIPLAVAAFAVGINPFIHEPGQLLVAAIAALILPAGMYLLSLPFGPGAIGIGDLKLLVGVGLLGGAWRLLAGLVFGAIVAAVAIVILVVARRITLRSYVPYGPFLIVGALWALLVLEDLPTG
jgi:leader peptidase (prepilin peptidase) / N-methyltransferase